MSMRRPRGVSRPIHPPDKEIGGHPFDKLRACPEFTEGKGPEPPVGNRTVSRTSPRFLWPTRTIEGRPLTEMGVLNTLALG